MAWAEGLGQELVTGSTGRVFPDRLEGLAAPARLARAAERGGARPCGSRWRWDGVRGRRRRASTRPTGRASCAPGSRSWRWAARAGARLGSDGAWAAHFPDRVAPFAPSNMGLLVAWSPHMARHFGEPVKGAAWRAGPLASRGEVVVSARGLEGGGLYPSRAPCARALPSTLDLFPDLSVDTLRARLGARGRESLANRLRKRLGLDGVRAALLQEWGRPLPADLAPLLKRLPVRHDGPRPLDEAISTAGGLRFEALTDGLMLRDRPGTFAAGEMLDWEAPTGGYLLTACLATGRARRGGPPRTGSRGHGNGESGRRKSRSPTGSRRLSNPAPLGLGGRDHDEETRHGPCLSASAPRALSRCSWPVPVPAQDRARDLHRSTARPASSRCPRPSAPTTARSPARVGYFGGQLRTSFTFQVTPRLLGHLPLLGHPGLRRQRRRRFWDRSFDLRYRFTDEGVYVAHDRGGPPGLPGHRHLLGRIRRRDQDGRRRGPRHRRPGLGPLRQPTTASTTPWASSRPLRDPPRHVRARRDQAASPGVDAFFRGDAAVFGGVEWAPNETLDPQGRVLVGRRLSRRSTATRSSTATRR